jgi:hypothetical protein
MSRQYQIISADPPRSYDNPEGNRVALDVALHYMIMVKYILVIRVASQNGRDFFYTILRYQKRQRFLILLRIYYSCLHDALKNIFLHQHRENDIVEQCWIHISCLFVVA